MAGILSNYYVYFQTSLSLLCFFVSSHDGLEKEFSIVNGLLSHDHTVNLLCTVHVPFFILLSLHAGVLYQPISIDLKRDKALFL